MGISNLLFKLYKIKHLRVRKMIRSLICRLEGGETYSLTLRKIFKKYHLVDIGLYTHGGCFIPFQIDRHTKIGRYCSFAQTARAMNRNHPLEFKSTHAMFCIASLQLCEKDLVEHIPLEIGNDVWLGHSAIIMPHVRKIGDGAVIAAGAVVNKDIPPYAVVVGNPARVVRFRFSNDVIEKLLASKWWEKSIEEIKPDLEEYQRPYESKKESTDNENNVD